MKKVRMMTVSNIRSKKMISRGYLNIGISGTPSWKCRSLLADLITVYLDECCLPDDRNRKSAVDFLRLSTTGRRNGIDVIIGNDADNNLKVKELYDMWKIFTPEDRYDAAKILYQLNTGIFAD